ncbi:MAG TPA: DMT family transporter, partial [Candidatus Baltobacteraceae bacterium]
DEGIALLSVVGLVASTLIFKRMRGDADLTAITGTQLLFGAALLAPGLLFESSATLPTSAAGAFSLAYLIVVMSVGASLLWFWLLRNGEASTVSAYYFLTPVFGVILSRLVLHERLVLSDALGTIVIAAGIALVQRAAVAPTRASHATPS